MSVSTYFKSIPFGQRYVLGWRVMGMLFSMYIALELFMRGLSWIGQHLGAWHINDVAAVWMYMVTFLVVAPPVASVFLGLFFPLGHLVKRDGPAA
ncbi:hypothetical protein ASD53_09685 [Lysobacter sp. Root559]|uniref:hypothetical protein n=1 Tax=Lysobacter sp. Root559 TaxID=1736559 RepID=UPI0006FC2511|nr:hypothetical protein [Lysobacter sp. Root559]KQZ57863.1 hypothetical protein ASD53_09685 [Lysobacter sp. Root559]